MNLISGFSFHNSISLRMYQQLQRAKSLEHTNASEAFKIYQSLAEEGMPAAQYQCGLMLLEGRGTGRKFNEAVSWFRLAAKTGHAGAKQSLAGVETRMAHLSNIVCSFEELNKPGELATKMTPDLQRAVVEWIMSEKIETGPESQTITCHDIKTAFSDLAEVIADPEVRNALKEVQTKDMGSFLQAGVVAYNRESDKSLQILTQESVTSGDCWNLIGQYMSLPNNISLSVTSTQHTQLYQSETSWLSRLREGAPLGDKPAKQFFSEHPEWRKDIFIPFDAAGQAYLKNSGITDSVLIRKIENGQLTVREIQAAQARIKREIKEIKPRIHRYIHAHLDNPWLQARLIDGTIFLDDFRRMDPYAVIEELGYQISMSQKFKIFFSNRKTGNTL